MINSKISILFIVAVSMVILFSGSSVFAVDSTEEPILENNHYYISVTDSLEIVDHVEIIQD